MMQRDVEITWLEMTDRSQFKAKSGYNTEVEVRLVENTRSINLMLFLQVGLPHGWYERLLWDSDKWSEYLEKNNGRLYIGYSGAKLIGYYELVLTDEASVEIKHFGLLPENIGLGLGGYFLSAAIESAWQLGVDKIFLHTCNYDSPNALQNYLARGFKVGKIENTRENAPEKEEFLSYISTYYSEIIPDK